QQGHIWRHHGDDIHDQLGDEGDGDSSERRETGKIGITTPGGIATSAGTFRVTPVISGFNPTSGAPGTSVVITGSGLRQTTKVTFGGIAATTFTVNSDTKVTAIVPPGAVTGKIAITTPGGTATSVASFTVI